MIRRGNNDPKKFEVPAHQWFDLSASDVAGGEDEYGVTVLEDCKYGSDKPADNVLRLTLLFTPQVGLAEIMWRDQGSQDWGRHEFAYGLYGHRGSWQEAGSTRQALRFNQPPRAFPLPTPVIAARCSSAGGEAIPTDRIANTPPTAHAPLGKRFSFLQLDTEQVGLRALKKAEDRDTLILRFYELWGRPTDEVTLTLNPALAGEGSIRAWETDGCERRLGELLAEGSSVRFAMGAFAIKTIELQLGPAAVQAPAPAYAPLALPTNLRAFTTDGERASGALPGGRSFPRELLPKQVHCEGVPLTLALDEELQAVACRGQEIALPSALSLRAAARGVRCPTATAISTARRRASSGTLLLLASADEDLEATLHLDGTPYRLRVQAGEGFIGQGDRRTWNRPMEKQPQYRFWARATGVVPGYLKRDRVGCYTTHMHSADGNEPYAFGYMFLYRVPLPAGVKVLRLPDDERVKVYAAAVCTA
jgi:alpha-mannosidase